MCLHRKGLGGFIQTVLQVELDAIEIHLPRLDFGKIQNVVDHCQQGVS